MYSYNNGYWGYTHIKHQKMRPSKRRKLNKDMKYDSTVILTPQCDMEVTLPDNSKPVSEIKPDVFHICNNIQNQVTKVDNILKFHIKIL